MKVVIVGGYGVFGSLTAQLLARDGHSIWLAGRHPEKARKLAHDLDAETLKVDIKNAPEAIFEPEPDLVIDAAGPFQFYQEDPYKIPRLCIEQGCHYLDLSDSAEFTRGIADLNDAARETNVFALSGASSVPGLSSIVVNNLIQGLDDVQLIDIAILPGNRAPRGLSVIKSIVSGVGRPSMVLRGGIYRSIPGWRDKRIYHLATDFKRAGYFVDVPDIHLLPEATGAQSVMFRAGLELPIMNWSLAFLARLRQRWHLELPNSIYAGLHWLSKALFPFGTDRGGMQVTVVGLENGKSVRRQWTLLAEHGDGPFIPGVVCRAILRHRNTIGSGARSCLAELPLSAIDDAMSDLSVSTKYKESDHPTLFQKTLADRWPKLPKEVRELHSVQDIGSFSGTAEVTRGRSLIAKLAARVFGFPKANPNAKLRVTKTRLGDGEIWERNFDGKIFRSYCSPAPEKYRYRERFGWFNFEQDLPVRDASLHFPVRRGWFLGIPLPQFLLPKSQSREFEENGVFHFDVSLIAPLGAGLIVRYRGSLQPQGI